MSTKTVFDWSMQQINWLNFNYDECSSVQQDNIRTIWTRLAADFLDKWPVRDMLWLAMPSSHILTYSE
ncbi:hypothetical protein P692DRAFT_20720228 [Suillus brevipes Sb2]|nr:hypothetical protein P692DRAFT_20720228 [Suillus brevipes Sb2]